MNLIENYENWIKQKDKVLFRKIEHWLLVLDFVRRI